MGIDHDPAPSGYQNRTAATRVDILASIITRRLGLQIPGDRGVRNRDAPHVFTPILHG